MKLSERHLAQLAAVLEAGSVSEGAAALGQTQPAVSRSLAMLEARVGAPLFIKGRRPLQATPLGALLAAQGRVILSASRKAADAVRGFVSGATGVVRVGGVPYFMDAMVSRMLGEFHTSEPEVVIEQFHGHTTELVPLLAGDQIDLAIIPIADLDLEDGYQFDELLPGYNIVACRSGHPLVRKGRLQAFDMIRYPWVAPLPGSPLMTDMQIILTSIGLAELPVRYAGASLMSAINFLAETDALAVLPYACVYAQKQEDRIRALSYDIPQPRRSIGILRRTGRARSPAAEHLTAYLASGFGALRNAMQRRSVALVGE